MSVKPSKITIPSCGDALVARNQAQVFQYSVPFTKDGSAHAKSIELQWKRITIFEVKEAFPTTVYRQRVVRKVVKTLEPIDVAVDDICMRIDSMNFELSRDKRDGADTNNLMRIVQGSVMPQVNGGVLEVARVFLPIVEQKEVVETIQAAVVCPEESSKTTLEQRKRLTNCLTEFLHCSKLLLDKCAGVLTEAAKAIPSGPDVAGDEDAAAKLQLLRKRQQETINNVMWVREMERSYEELSKSMSLHTAPLRP